MRLCENVRMRQCDNENNMTTQQPEKQCKKVRMRESDS